MPKVLADSVNTPKFRRDLLSPQYLEGETLRLQRTATSSRFVGLACQTELPVPFFNSILEVMPENVLSVSLAISYESGLYFSNL